MSKAPPEEVIDLVNREGVEIVDFRFCDRPGLMQHYSMPAHELTTRQLSRRGPALDGSRFAVQEIGVATLLLVPTEHAVMDHVPPAPRP